MRTRETFDNLPANTLISRGDIAHIAGVTLATVQGWAQDHADNGFPETRRVPGRHYAFHRLGEVVEWLCTTGRSECGLTDGMVNLAGVAERFKVSDAAVKQWRHRGHFPAPDLVVARSPYWKLETLEAFTPPGERRRTKETV